VQDDPERRDSPESRRSGASLRQFLHTEAAGGAALLIAAAVAMVWANSPWRASYERLWSTDLSLTVGGHGVDLSLHGWVTDGLMTLFFFVVGLEIKRELTVGELREPRRAALPAIAALGGMLAPALLYAAFNAGGPGAAGWGIPVATDIAVAVGVVSLLGAAVDPALKLFLLALAIADDVGAIVVIAVFYCHGLDVRSALVALGLVAVVVGCQLAGVRAVAVHVVVGVALWLAVLDSGIHATIAGVVLGLLTPTRPEPVAQHIERVLHPWTSFVVVPLFALANAGVVVTGGALRDAWSSPVTHGVVVGLVVGKLVGVSVATWLGVRLGLGRLPPGATPTGVVGIAAVAGIGFTVSLFVTELAFDDPALQDEAKIGILVASAIAGALGTLLLRRRSRTGERRRANLSP